MLGFGSTVDDQYNEYGGRNVVWQIKVSLVSQLLSVPYDGNKMQAKYSTIQVGCDGGLVDESELEEEFKECPRVLSMGQEKDFSEEENIMDSEHRLNKYDDQQSKEILQMECKGLNEDGVQCGTGDPWKDTYPFVCDKCGWKFESNAKCEEHTASCACEKVACNQCYKEFKSFKTFNKHFSTTHSECKWQCKYCSQRFRRKRELILHDRRVHDKKPYECTKCDKTFDATASMKLYLRSHDIKDYPCKVCGKVTKSNLGLHTHIRIHSRDRPNEGKIFGSRFQKKLNLQQHTNLAHRNLHCKICGQGMKTLATMRGHLAFVHNEKMQYKCRTCSEIFLAKNELRAHRRKVHPCPGQQCAVCGKIISKNNYRYHIQRHEEGKKA